VANVLRNPYSNVAGNTPASLGNGQIAVQQADGKLFYRNSAGVVTSFSSIASYATTASFPLTGLANVLYLSVDSSRAYQFASGVYVEVGVSGGGGAAHASTHATGGSDAITPESIGAASLSHTQAAATITDFATEAAKYGPVASVNGLTGAVTVPVVADGSKGDITVSASGATWTINANAVVTADIASSAVTYAKIQNVSATDRLLGRSSAGEGVVEEITCTAFGRALLDDASASAARTTLGIGTIATAASGDYLPIGGGTLTGATTISAAAGAALNLTATGGTAQVAQAAGGFLYITNYVPDSQIIYNLLGSGSFRFYTSASDVARIDSRGFSVGVSGSAASPSISLLSDANTGLFFPSADTLALATGGTERLRVDATGAVTIGGSNVATVASLLPHLGGLTSAADVYPRTEVTGGTVSVTNGNVFLVFFTPLQTITVSQITMVTGNTVAASGLTFAQMGLYSYDETTATLVARCASDTTLFTAINTTYTRSFNTTGGFPATYTLQAGTRYGVAVLLAGTTMPVLSGKGVPAGMLGLTPKTAMTINGQTSLPSSSTALQITSAHPFARLS
jgi:hypothetical protein